MEKATAPISAPPFAEAIEAICARIVLMHAPNRILVLIYQPLKCIVCRTAHLLFINRNGHTACVGCTPPMTEAEREPIQNVVG